MIEVKIKLILVGDSGAGKSSFLKRKVDDMFNPEFVSTIGVDFNTLKFYKGNYLFKTYIWDTAGQEKFNTLVQVYFRDLTAGLIMYDVNCRESYENIDNWINKIRKHTDNLPIFIIGTKIDVKNKREVFPEDLDKYKKQNIPIFECSAKENINIDLIFEFILEYIHKKIKNKELHPPQKYGIRFNNISHKKLHALNIEESDFSKKYKCCNFI
jgi:small GTP-binding protein